MGSNPWTYIIVFSLVIMAGAVLLGVMYSLLIAKAAARYSDKTLDKYEKAMCKLLPGKDCGRCGCETCQLYAQAVLRAEKDDDKCPYTDEMTQKKMLLCREKLQKLMEDPTPPRDRKESFWDKKF